tara:strand:- start:1460 stop:2008 length:549 start_codon:yes stop_codon:yes gene_type:complete
MTSPLNDPTYIKDKDKYFMQIAKSIATASTHPTSPGGCVLVRDREIIGDGRSLLCASKVEIDCLTYAIAATSKRGTPTSGAVVYSTRYPFSASIFQCHVMGIKRICILSHEWEPYYKDEFRRAARLARELSISIEPFFEGEDPRFAVNSRADRSVDEILYTDQESFVPDKFDPQVKEDILDD